MATDLPKRPENKEEESRIVSATDRVKSAGDKLDPRFEAARQKAEREEKLRAKAKKKARAKQTKAKSDTESTSEPSDDKDGGSFSFNMTAGDAEEDK